MKIAINLKTALLVNYIIMAVVPILVIGLISLHFQKQDLLQNVSHQNTKLAATVTDGVETFLRQSRNFLSYAGKTALRRNGKRIVREDALLDLVVETYGIFESVLILDRHGKVLNVGLPGHSGNRKSDYLGRDMSMEEFFQRARAGLRHRWSRTFISSVSGEPAVTLSIPLGNEMVVGILNLRMLERLITPLKGQGNTYGFVTDNEGSLLAHPTRSHVLNRRNVSDLALIREGLAGRPGTHRYVFEGVDKQGSVVRVSETGWLVGITQPVAVAIAPVKRIEKMFLGGLLVTIAVAILNAAWSLTWLLQPFHSLAVSTGRIAAGDYSAVIGGASDSLPLVVREYSALADQVRTMARAIMSREDELRARNEDLHMTEEELRQQVDEYLRTQNELIQLNNTLEALFRAAPMAVIALDAEGKVTLWNPAARDLFGWNSEEVEGCTLPIVPEENGDECRALMARALSGELLRRIELRRRGKDGTLVDVSLSSAALLDAGNRIAGVINLYADIREVKLAEEQIRKSLSEKEILLKEIHHRVKNNLQIISSLLNLQYRFISDPHDREMFRDSQNRVRSMAVIHETLYQTRDFSHLDFAVYIRTLMLNLFRTYGIDESHVRLVMNIEDGRLNLDTAMPCGLIVNELVSNSLKYAFPAGRSGEILIKLQEHQPGQYILVVRDDGVGLVPDFDPHTSSSLGLQLVSTLTEQIGGVLEIVREKGTEFRITFGEVIYRERI